MHRHIICSPALTSCSFDRFLLPGPYGEPIRGKKLGELRGAKAYTELCQFCLKYIGKDLLLVGKKRTNADPLEAFNTALRQHIKPRTPKLKGKDGKKGNCSKDVDNGVTGSARPASVNSDDPISESGSESSESDSKSDSESDSNGAASIGSLLINETDDDLMGEGSDVVATYTSLLSSV